MGSCLYPLLGFCLVFFSADPRFTTLAFGYFSTLLISVVSKNDEGNITCIGQERNITINLGGGFRKDYISFSGVTEI